MPDRDGECDIVVVGAGSAGFQAAVAASQAGAKRVVIVEKGPELELGGNARYSPTIFRFVHRGDPEIREFLHDIDDATFAGMRFPPYTASEFVDDLTRISHGRADPVLVRTLVENSNAALHWMLGLGFLWQTTQRFQDLDGVLHFDPGMAITPRGGGLGQIERWKQIADGLGIEVRFDSGVVGLLGNSREVEGIRVSDPDGDYDVRAGATILCSGGFQASPEKRARYLGGNADLMKVLGSRNDTGEVMTMALDLGAAETGHWQGAHSSPVDGAQPDQGWGRRANRQLFAHGITVNRRGRRFLDEGAPPQANIDGWIERLVLREPGGIAYQVFDAKGRRFLTEDYAEGSFSEADTLESLAEIIQVDPDALTRTVAEFNAAVREDVPFDREQPDGRSTQGIDPPKSNWARRLDAPPFFAYPVTAGITFSFGGLRINSSAQVMSTTGRPIDGLYASGDIIGFYYDHHLNASGQTRNAVFSRLAAQHAAANRLRSQV